MKRFKNILYVNESTVDQASAVERAVTLAENNHADMTVVDVIPTQVVMACCGLPSAWGDATELQTAIMADRRNFLESMLQPYKQRLNIRVDVLVGKTFLEVIRAVLKNAFDLVVKPAENPNWAHRLFGSDDMHLLRKCPCPVWLMKPPEKSNYGSILVAVDFDPLNPLGTDHDLNREILELASSLALSDFASLHLVHAWEAFAETNTLARGGMSPADMVDYVEKEGLKHRNGLSLLAGEMRGWIGKDAYDFLSPRFHLPKGPAKKMIAPLAAELKADLVVMGTIARTGISGLIIGNTAEAIIEQLSCSLLAVKAPGFTTPVKLSE